MAVDLNTVDPTWAWRPFEPSADRPWNRPLAAHLHRRAGFGATGEELKKTVERGLPATLDGLLDAGQASKEFDARIEQLATAVLGSNDPRRLSAWWLYRMIGTPAPCLEKTTLFWHGHFATSAAKVEDSDMMLAQYRLLHQHALGKFAPLVQGISRDPAMLEWLDSTTNRKIHPNENYAREVMELFCLGVGNYTEKDIQQVARAFTGWEVRRGKFEFNPYQHDTGAKTILGKSGNYNGDQAVEIILDQPAAPRFIVRKLFRYFVCDEPGASPELIEPLAKQLRDNGFNIGPVVRTILGSNLFFSEHAIARKVRSPVELGVGMLRALEGTTNVYKLADGLEQLGQAVFYPPNVKGWDGGRTWINSSTLLGRANLIRTLLTANETRFAEGRGLAVVAQRAGIELAQPGGPERAVDWLAELLLAVPLSAAVREPLVKLAQEPMEDPNRRLARLVHAVCALPEFQLS
jgi:uncharacterized protein (DUF1800 family)